MSIKKIFKDGMAEHKRKSSLRSSKRNLAEKGKAYEVKLTALGKKARDAKLDISQFGDLSGTLSQVEEKGKEIGAKLNELNKQTAELGGKKKAENSRFDALWKDLETKKKPVDSELKSEKDKLEKAQKEADSIQKRLKDIPDEEEKIRKKITESQGNAQAQAELEKKLTALKEEQKQLDPKLPGLTKIIQAASEKITPLDQQSGRLEAEMKKAKDQHKKEIEDIDKTLSKVKGEIDEFNKQQKAVSGQQVQNFQALGKKLSEVNVADPAIAAELEAVKAAEKEMASIRAAIQSLESQKAPDARGAVLKMAGLMLLFLAIIAAIAVGIVFLTKHKAGRKGGLGKSETQVTQVDKGVSQRIPQEPQTSPSDQETSDFVQIAEPVSIPQSSGVISEEYQKTLLRLRAAIDFSNLELGLCQSKIGSGPEAIFRFVQNEIRFEPYQGVLRGARGTLLARSGNTLDRALLLAALLKAAGYNIRYAENSLSVRQAEDIMLTSFKQPLLSGSDYAYQEELEELAASHFVLLDNTLFDAGFHVPTGDAGEWQRSVREAQDHVWIQFDDKGRWTDVDPTPGVPFGQSLLPAQQVMQKIKKELYQIIEFSVEVELLDEGQRTRQVTLAYKTPTSDLAGLPVGLFHNVQKGETTAFLLIGNQLYRGKSFNASREGGESSGGFFPLAPRGEKPADVSALTGEWLHICIKGPAGQKETTYTIADSIGLIARSLGSSGRQDSNQIMNDLEAVFGISVITGRVPSMLPASLLSDISDPQSKVALCRALSCLGFGYFEVRQSMPFSFLEQPPIAYFDSPNIIVVRVQNSSQSEAIELSFDLTLKAYRILRLPQDNFFELAHFYDYLSSGVMDHLVERYVQGWDRTAASVGSLIETAFDQNMALQTLTADSPNLEMQQLSPDGKQRAVESLRIGKIIIIPESRPNGWPQNVMGWWSVDPATGWTEDSTELGAHSALSQAALTERSVHEKKRRADIKTIGCYCILALIRVMPIIIDAAAGSPELVEISTELADHGGVALVEAKCKGKEGMTKPSGPGKTHPPGKMRNTGRGPSAGKMKQRRNPRR